MFSSEIWCPCTKTRYSYVSPNYTHLGVYIVSPYSHIWNDIKKLDLFFCSFPKTAYLLLGVQHCLCQCICMHMLIYKFSFFMFVFISGFMSRLCEIIMCCMTHTKPGLILCMRDFVNFSVITHTNVWIDSYNLWWHYWRFLYM